MHKYQVFTLSEHVLLFKIPLKLLKTTTIIKNEPVITSP